MPLRPDELETIAHLARLAIDESHIPGFVRDLSVVPDMIEQIGAVDTSTVEPMANPLDACQRLRPDAVTESDQRELFQTVAPATEDGLYLVPRVIE